jgi:hypothetical protein
MALPADDLILWTELPDEVLPARPTARFVRDGAALALTVPVDGGFVAVGLPVMGESGSDPRTALVAEVDARALVDPELAAVATRLARLDGRFAGVDRVRAFVEELAESIRLFSLNAILAAHRLADSAAIGAVAGLLQTRSDAAVPDLRALAGQIERAAAAHAEARFAVAAAALVAGHPEAAAAVPTCRTAANRRVVLLDAGLAELASAVATIDSHFKTIRFLELQGRIEAARASDTGHVLTLFEEIGRQVRAAGAELAPYATPG